MQNQRRRSALAHHRLLPLVSAPFLLWACGGQPNPHPDGGAAFEVGGTVTGLLGAGLVLQNNLGDDLAISSDGRFSFPTSLATGSEYIVTVKSQPTSPWQTCSVSKYTGTIASSDVTDVDVACTTNQYPIGGTVTGLAGSGLVLQDNGGDDLPVASDGTFTFATAVSSGAAYSVSVKAQPSSPTQRCTVSNAAGTVGGSAVAVSVSCINTYYLSGVISGLTLPGLVLTSPGAPDLALDVGATTFSFGAKLPDGAAYAVSVPTQPAGLRCTVSNGAGTIASSDVTSVAVQCVRVWSRIATGGYHSTGVTTDGTVWTWGLNTYGQIGDNTTISRLAPVQIGSGYTSVAAGQRHTVAVKTDGTLWAWGGGESGQLGIDNTVPQRAPVQVGTGYISVVAGDAHTLAAKTDGTLWAWGANGSGQVGDNTTIDRLTPVQVGSGFASVAAGSVHTVAVKTDGTLWAWGSNYFGQLGDNTTTDRHLPVQIGSGYASVAAGQYHTLAVKTDGTLWAWGDNYRGQLGGYFGSSQLTPAQIGSGYTSVAASGDHSLALKTDGTLWVWGDNANGQLGDNTTTERDAPTPIP